VITRKVGQNSPRTGIETSMFVDCIAF